MPRRLASLLILALTVFSAGGATAAGMGDRCKTGSNVASTYLCPIGTLCLQSIEHKYCARADKQCGRKNAIGMNLGQTMSHEGDEYVCTPTGFEKVASGAEPPPPPAGASVGEECQVGPDVAAEHLCPVGTLCLQAIDRMYCSHATRQCGWPGTPGYQLGQTKAREGVDYVCTPTGFEVAATDDQPSQVISVPNVTDLPTAPKVRVLKATERELLGSVYGSSINYGMVRITNTEGVSDGAPWTTNTPPFYTVNVGVHCYVGFERDDCRDGDGLGLLIHELAHVWQGQHGIPFMMNSLYHQRKAVAEHGDRNRAYDFEPGAQWRTYNAEQQARIVETWYRDGLDPAHELYPYIRDNVRPGMPHATTRLPTSKSTKDDARRKNDGRSRKPMKRRTR